MSNKNLLNSELLEKFQQQLDSGQVCIIDVQNTSNDEYTMLYLAQIVDSGNGDEANKLFLGWDGSVQRCLRNMKKDQLAKIEKALSTKMEIGNVLPKGWNIEVTDSTSFKTLQTWVDAEGNMQEEQPRKFGKNHPHFAGEVCVDINGLPIYRRTELVKRTPVNTIINAANAELTPNNSDIEATLAGKSANE